MNCLSSVLRSGFFKLERVLDLMGGKILNL